MELFTTKVKVERLQTNGTNKKVTETYVVDAVSVADAEAITAQELGPGVNGEFEVSSATKVKYSEIFGEGADKYYQAKVLYITLDEKTGAEKKNASLMLINANNFKAAYDALIDGMKGAMSDWELAEIKETVIIDLLHHS